MLTISSLRSSILAAAVLALAGVTSARAAPVEIGFNHTSNTRTQVATITGTTGGLISFQLDLGDPALGNVQGNFSLDIEGPGGVPLGSASLIGFDDQPTAHLGDAAANPFDLLANISDWTFNAGPSDLSLALFVTSQLDASFAPFTPRLTVDLGGDLQIAQVPLPGALVLFGTGLGIFGLVSTRRRRLRTGQVA